jgi:ATP-binding cassette, subfamily C (CFTR/MRP), member 4
VLKLSITLFIPAATQLISECVVSVTRIEEFLSLPNLQKEDRSASSVFINESADVLVKFEKASFSWDDKGNTILNELNFSIKKNTLTCICGPVGAGKTSLLNAILGDMNLMAGVVGNRASKVAYVSQTPWIMSGTIRDSILFGQPYDSEKFSRVVQCCSLARDFSLFPNGVDTFIGERGVTLSGGQRARVALARAVYHDAELYVLDDPLSAVDTKVARHIFEECIQGILKEKTILLVTHQLQFVKHSDMIIALEKGRITENGHFLSILKSQSSFAETLRDFSNDQIEDENKLPKGESQPKEDLDIGDPSVKSNAFDNEESAKGTVPLSTYYRYFRSGSGLAMTICLFFAMILGQTLLVSADFWLAHFSSQNAATQRDPIYVSVFIGLAVLTFVIALGRAFLFFFVCIKSSRRLFMDMLMSVFNSPMSFFQANPHGRVMNRFSKDTNLMDETLPQVFFDLLQCVFITLGVLIVTCIVFPYLLFLYPFLAYIFYRIQQYYIQTSRQVKRFEAITRSPVYSCIPSTLEGLSVIRAFGAENRIKEVFFQDQDDNTRMFFVYLSSGRWLGMRLDFLAALLLTIILFTCVPLRVYLNISPSLLGLMLSYMFQMIGTLQYYNLIVDGLLGKVPR